MRHDGEWFTTATEPGEGYALMHERQGNAIRYSNIWYGCDEFPPATW